MQASAPFGNIHRHDLSPALQVSDEGAQLARDREVCEGGAAAPRIDVDRGLRREQLADAAGEYGLATGAPATS